ncbi:uncharacterized protein BCR38DRAFT_81832 [Pseudomassariella vexata]|uniref:Vacuolar sorting protein Vps3844 C-terminal domain-containing protein n=1 Tax=Pseudomassariella vexata TaxID=1141098 RepID=A0A1Y2DFG3_9PEZI|nr:uncharacterized protein BCR38DRAFT_81832 [Pseudomassariella vexata]ORY57886.1 hypothetical protein BCR38DRAFT_81832 [Pseudomassariella vexata]
MKLSSFLLPALAGVVTAASQQTEGYLLRKSPDFKSQGFPHISNDVAQAIIQQRLGANQQLPQDESSISLMNSVGVGSRPLFHSADEPNQLVIVYKGVNDQSAQAFRDVMHLSPAFYSDDMTTAHLASLPASGRCSFEESTDPELGKCWMGSSQYLEYDVTKTRDAVSKLSKNFERLQSLAEASKMETMIVLVPSTSDATSELRRREFGVKAEEVLTEESTTGSTDSSFSKPQTSDLKTHPFVAKNGVLPACFKSFNTCMTDTGDCSRHGKCTLKYKNTDANAGNSECWSCLCHFAGTYEEDQRHPGSKIHHYWGGQSCQKIDVSAQFWLLAGFAIVMIGVLGGSIGLLFSVGEEKLPGVIGAGVSRSK